MRKKLIIIGIVILMAATILYCSQSWYIAGEPNSGVTATQAQSIAALAKSATWTTAMWRTLATLAGSASDSTKIDSLLESSTNGLAAVDEKVLVVYMPDVSTADTAYVVSPWNGIITSGYTVLGGLITAGQAKIFVAAPWSGTYDDSCTVDTLSSNGGEVDTIKTFTQTGDTILAGQAIGIRTNGSSTTTAEVWITLRLKLY